MTYSAYNDKSLGFSTQQLHAGYNPAEHFGAKAVPIYQTAAFELGSFDRCDRLFSYEEEGDSYVRFSNPTNRVLEQRIAQLEGGSAALALGSGMAAISNTLLNLALPGDNIVAVRTLYGGSITLLDSILPTYGITANWVENPDDLDAYRAAITPQSKAIYIEALGNPCINVVDIEAIAELAHEHGIPLVIDATFATPYLLRPFEFGADIICHSSTKYLAGHGTTISGIVVEKGDFNWQNGKFPQFDAFFNEYEGAIDSDELKRTAFTRRLRMVFLTEFGAHLGPYSAFLVLQGIETLSLRMRRHASNAIKVATFLEAHPQVLEVSYPSLPSSPYHALASKYFPLGSGAVLAVRVKGGLAKAQKILDSVRIFSYITNVGDTKSLIVHPATSIQHGLPADVQEQAGVYDDLLRLSIGIEHVDDLIADLEQALS